MSDKLRVGIIGATGMVGQRFVTLLEDHPYFKINLLAASKKSAGLTYGEAVSKRWKMQCTIPADVSEMTIVDAEDVDTIRKNVDMLFCAVNMKKEDIKKLEDDYAKAEIPVVSNNSANRGYDDVPVIIPEINPEHLSVIKTQRERLGTERGFICCKPNCSIQSYVPMLTPLRKFGIEQVVVSTYQAISGAGKTLTDFPDILDNVIPYIGGEEEKSEREPMKIWGSVVDGKIVDAESPIISAQCLRVPVSDGHTATVSVNFKNKPSKEQIIELWKNYSGAPQKLGLPSAPDHFITYFEEDDRPQARLDRYTERGMGVCAGRLREDNIFDYKFVGFSHNTLRGAAGGGVLMAELLYREGYLD